MEEEEGADTCYRSGSSWYADIMCDRRGWLPKRNWAPLVFYLLLFLFCMFLTAMDNSISLRARAGDMMLSLLFFVVLASIITMLILKNHIGWAWFFALLPFILFFLGLIVIIFMMILGTTCPHCTGKCIRDHSY